MGWHGMIIVVELVTGKKKLLHAMPASFRMSVTIPHISILIFIMAWKKEWKLRQLPLHTHRGDVDKILAPGFLLPCLGY